MEIKLIASDFDGTLRRAGKVSEKDRKAIKKWQTAGKLFGMDTGRGSDFCEYIRTFGIEPDFLILCNGALIYDKNGDIIYENSIPSDVFKALQEEFTLTAPTEDFSSVDDGENEKLHVFRAVFANREQAVKYNEHIVSLFGDKVTSLVNGNNINIMNKGINKASGIYEVLKYYGLQKEEAAAIGDDHNDVDMLKEFDGWVPINGLPAIKKIANHITMSVAGMINKLM